MKKRTKIIISFSLLLFCAAGIFLADSYAEASVKLPNRFGPLSGFVFEKAAFFAEFPSLSRQLSRFKKSRAGRKFTTNPLTRDIFVRPLEKKLLSLIRKLRAASGLPLDEKKITALLSRPFALIGSTGGKQMEYLGILKVSAGDRLLISIFSRMGNALYSRGTISRTKWSGAVLYTVGSGKPGAVTFALINNALLFSVDRGMIKKALQAAATVRPDRPEKWVLFLRKNPIRRNTFCRIYFKSGLLRTLSPVLAAALYTGRTGEPENRTAGISVTLLPSLSITGGIFSSPAVTLDRGTLRMTPARHPLSLSGNFSMVRTKLISMLNRMQLGESGEKIRKSASALAERLGNNFTLHASGLAEKNRRMIPAVAVSWKITRDEKRILHRESRKLIRSLPGCKQRWKRYLGIGYSTFTGYKKAAFNPCMAFLGSNRFCLSSTEKTMRSLIRAYKGRERSLYDDPAVRIMRRKSRKEKPVRLIRIDVQKIITGLYARLGNYAFRSPEFNRRDVMSVFRPILRTGLPWKKISLLASSKQGSGYIRIQTRFH